MKVPSAKLSSGHDFPFLGLGTWLAEPGVVAAAVDEALKAGYRHIDCAHAYLNQPEIGEVFNKVFNVEKSVKREDVFITSKIWNTFHSYERAKGAVDMILKELQLEYLDLLLIHWPMGYEEGGEFFPKEGDKMRFSNEDYLDTWKALEEAVAAGKVRSIGLSNFNHKQIQRVIEHAKIKPAVLQIELHPYFQRKQIRDFCKANNIIITAYCSLGNNANPFRKPGDSNLLEEPAVVKIAANHSKTTAHVALRWAIQHGLHVIPKSTSAERIKSNGDVFDFELSAAEMAEIDGLEKNWQIINLKTRDSEHPHFPYKSDEDY